jgi:hypothetical protein
MATSTTHLKVRSKPVHFNNAKNEILRRHPTARLPQTLFSKKKKKKASVFGDLTYFVLQMYDSLKMIITYTTIKTALHHHEK